MSVIINLLLFLILLVLIVAIHEWGHYIAAKAFNVYVPEYSIGMGKALYKKKGKETTFSIRCLPIGGYCAIAQDVGVLDETTDVEMIEVPKERTLAGIAKWKKIIIMLAGVTMNFILAILIMGLVYLSFGQAKVSPKPIVSTVVEGSPADLAGLKANDEIKEITLANGYSLKPSTFSELTDFMSLYTEGDITLEVNRDNETLTIKVTPTLNDEGSYILGITSHEYDTVDVNILNCWGLGINYLWEMTKLIWTTLLGLFRGVGYENLSGPVGIYTATSQAVSLGSEYYFVLIAAFSLNVGIFNLIPIPALDGGRVVLTIIEAIIKKPIPKKVEEYIMTGSVILFLLLFVFATGQDILRLFNK